MFFYKKYKIFSWKPFESPHIYFVDAERVDKNRRRIVGAHNLNS